MIIDRDRAPQDAALETPNRITTHELARALDAIYEGKVGSVDKLEAIGMIKAMREPTAPLTLEYLESLKRPYELSPAEKERFMLVRHYLGFPTEDEYIAIEAVDPMKMEWLIHAERGNVEHEGIGGVLNNEFTFFTFDPYDLRKFPEGRQDVLSAFTMKPALLRLQATFPGLAKSLLDYARAGRGKRQHMIEFYDGLIEENERSRQMLVLFTFADSLLQRLVRPKDHDYQAALMGLGVKGKPFANGPTLPKYDEIPYDDATAIKVAHHAMWE